MCFRLWISIFLEQIFQINVIIRPGSVIAFSAQMASSHAYEEKKKSTHFCTMINLQRFRVKFWFTGFELLI